MAAALDELPITLAFPPFPMELMLSVPLFTVVAPVYVLLALRTSVPVPFCVRFPVPVMAAALKSVPCVTVFERLNASVALFDMAPLAESDPVVPPFPSCKVPVLIFVSPV